MLLLPLWALQRRPQQQQLMLLLLLRLLQLLHFIGLWGGSTYT